MAVDSRKKAKARRLYEYDGISQESIAEIIGVSRKSIENWMRKAEEAKDPWVKGRYSQEIRDKEEAAKVKAIEAHGWNEGRVLAELGLIAGSDIRELLEVQKDGTVKMKDLASLGEKSRVIKSLKQRKTTRKDGRKADADTLEDVTLEVQVWDKTAALTKIGEHLGLFKTEAQKVFEAGVFSYYRDQLAKKRGKA
jgi:transposase